MDREKLKALLEEVQAGRLSPDQALARLRERSADIGLRERRDIGRPRAPDFP